MNTTEGKKLRGHLKTWELRSFSKKWEFNIHNKSLYIGGGVSIDKEVYLHSLWK